MAKTSNIQKTASGAAEAKYWSELLGPEYGKLLTRNIPKRVKAALAVRAQKSLNKQASAELASAEVAPLSYGLDGNTLTVEGIVRQASGEKLLFVADFLTDGTFKALETRKLS